MGMGSDVSYAEGESKVMLMMEIFLGRHTALYFAVMPVTIAA